MLNKINRFFGPNNTSYRDHILLCSLFVISWCIVLLAIQPAFGAENKIIECKEICTDQDRMNWHWNGKCLHEETCENGAVVPYVDQESTGEAYGPDPFVYGDGHPDKDRGVYWRF